MDSISFGICQTAFLASSLPSGNSGARHLSSLFFASLRNCITPSHYVTAPMGHAAFAMFRPAPALLRLPDGSLADAPVRP